MSELKKVQVNDIQIAYREYGAGEPAVIMINGLGGTMQNYVDNPGLVNKYAEKHRTVIFDNRGAGETDVGEKDDVTISTMAADTIGLMDALGIGKAVISGGSMGGMIAQQIAVDYPERVEKLVLISTWPGGAKTIWPSPELTLYLTVPGYGSTGALRTINPLELVFSKPGVTEMETEVLEEIANQYFDIRQVEDVGFARQQRAIESFDVCDRICAIQVPTIIFAGRYDPLIPPENGVIMAREIRDCRFHLLAESSHATIEDADAMAELIAAFLEE